MSRQRGRLIDALALAALKIALGAWVLHAGFTHVSDDDYARTVIAQRFAHAPRLDPSGTSWLPAPFWIEGATMMALGRTLGVARGLALLLGAASVAAPYLGMRVAGMRREAALAAAALAMALPWNAWLGVATVPEGWVGALAAAALVVWTRRPMLAAAALLVASLSRYEAWPACAALAAACAWRAVRAKDRRREGACILVAVAGPLAWLVWNAHAHGSPLHFAARVTTFRHAVGAADAPLADKLLDYPRALVGEAPVAAALGAVGVASLAWRAARARWLAPAAASAFIVASLVWGDAHDGAPTHHPARALVEVWWVLVAMGVDAIFDASRRIADRWRRPAAGAVLGCALSAVAALAMVSTWPAAPGSTESERRDAQIARGRDMARKGVTAAYVTPCQFEHFALLAAWGAPERATIAPRTGQPVTASCPVVVER